LLIGRGLIAVDLDRRGRGRVVTERDYSRQSRRLDAGKRADAIEQLSVKDFRAIEFVTRRKQIDYRHDYVVGEETGTGVLHSLQALQKQAGAGEENKT
jgi:hypothetical protein